MFRCYENNMHAVLKMPSSQRISFAVQSYKNKYKMKHHPGIKVLISMMLKMSAGHLQWISIIDQWNCNSVETIEYLLNWNLIYLFLLCSAFMKKA